MTVTVWALIPTFLAGAMFGILIVALSCANRDEE